MSHTFFKQTTSLLSESSSTEKLFNKDDSGHDRNHRETQGSKDTRATTSTGCGFLLKDVFGKEARWLPQANFRSKKLKQVCFNQPLSTGVAGDSDGVPSRPGLVGEDRSSPGLLSPANIRKSSPLPAHHLQQGSVAIDRPTIWPVICPPYFRGCFELDRGDPSSPRYSCSGIPGRLPVGPSGPLQVDYSGCGNREYLGDFGVAHKLPKIYLRTHTAAGLSWPDLEHTRNDYDITRTKGKKYKSNTYPIKRQGKLHLKRTSKHIGTLKLCELNSSKRPSALSQTPDVPQEVQSGSLEGKKSVTTTSCERVGMVAEGCREEYNLTKEDPSHSFSHHRRSGCGLGSAPERVLPVRSMESTPTKVALKCQRNVCSVRCDCQSPKHSKRCPYINSNGQSDSSCVHTKRRRDQINSTSGSDHKATSPDRSAQRDAVGVLPPGEVERNSRSIVQRTSSTRMASSAPGHRGHISSVGRARNRPFCVKKKCHSSKVRNIGLTRWLRAILRRLQSPVGLAASMGVPTAKPNTTCASTSEQCQGQVHCNSSSVDAMLLAPRPEGEGPGGALTNTQPRVESDRPNNRTTSTTSKGPNFSSLEGWGWGSQVAHWNEEEKQLLTSSWRKSTLATYGPPIRRWITWCETNNIDSKSPSGKDVAQFLARLYLDQNFAYSTILLHKSAISTYCANNTDEKITSNFLVHQILKAISVAKPKSNKAPIWDIKLLFTWLKETPMNNSLFDISRRTALILLLASGRRLHDLTLLNMANDKFIQGDTDIILWPDYGSKTDSGTFQQSGWQLLKHPDPSICPVRHIQLLIQASQKRRAEEQIDKLFISITGKIKPASKTMIAGWIKTIFKAAEIEAPPGSIRSAVASRGWLENRPVEEILQRGNWRSEQTFKKFYCRPVQLVDRETSDLLSSNFSAI